jgi:hypothetical protein
MATRKIIAFSSPQNSGHVDVELPGDVPLQELLPDLIKTLFDNADSKDLENASLLNEEGELLDIKKSLDKNGIQNSETISIETGGNTQTISAIRQTQGIRSTKRSANHKKPAVSAGEDGSVKPTSELAKDRRGQLGKARKSGIKVEHPCLLYENDDQGYLFILGSPLSSIGRPKRDYKPNIDLSEIDLHKVSSRHHAEIEKKGSKFVLRALETTNGMRVNESDMDVNETRVLQDNDVLQFGFQGVKLVFRLPPKK